MKTGDDEIVCRAPPKAAPATRASSSRKGPEAGPLPPGHVPLDLAAMRGKTATVPFWGTVGRKLRADGTFRWRLILTRNRLEARRARHAGETLARAGQSARADVKYGFEFANRVYHTRFAFSQGQRAKAAQSRNLSASALSGAAANARPRGGIFQTGREDSYGGFDLR